MLNNTAIRHLLELTLQEAEKALDKGNYPIASLIIDARAKVISLKRNQCKTKNDVSAHAEILNLGEVGIANTGNLIMFSSLEPCFGCSFFIARSKITKVFSALKDPHKGGISDLKKQAQFANFFEKIELINEPFIDLKERSKSLMKDYFLKLGSKDKAKFYGFPVANVFPII